MKTLTSLLVFALLFISADRLSAQCCSKDHKKHASASPTEESKVKATLNKDGVQEAKITVKDGYHPSTIIAKKGVPLKLNFDLQEKSCTGTVIFKELDQRKDLAYKKLTALEFTPNATGSFVFACPMDMFKGTLVVED